MAQHSNLGLARWWRELISQQPGSGMTIAAFCKSHQVSTASFYLWRRKLKDSQPEPADPFLRVEVVSAQDNDANELPFRVHLPGGATVEIPSRQRDVLLGVVDQLQRAGQSLQAQEYHA